MKNKPEDFTKYEVARIIGARALQIAMDAPLLLKVSDEDLKAMQYDALKIAEKEFSEGVLPITIHRPQPRRGKDKLEAIKEESVSDEELKEKEKEVEKDIVEKADELGFTQQFDEEPETEIEEASEEQ